MVNNWPGVARRAIFAAMSEESKKGSRPVPPAADARDNHPRRAVMPQVTHASTFLASSLEDFEAMGRTRPGDGLTYALHGSEGVYACAEEICALEGGYRTRICQSGLSAVTAPFLAFLSAGDHLLMVDSCYDPLRGFCDRMLSRFGVSTTYYDPKIGGGIRDLIRPNTRMIHLESPGSLTFEMQDIPAIVDAASAADIWTSMDATWASPLYFRPLEHGVDISVQAVTKYLSGHSDLLLGAVTTTREAYPKFQTGWRQLGHSAGPDDVYLAHRGLQTFELRMARHQSTGLRLADWLAAQPEVVEVLHPALETDPGHAIWRRDFDGAGGLFGFTLRPASSSRAQLQALLDPMRRFGLGYSWGGPQSLMTPSDPSKLRTATPWPRPDAPAGQLMRIFAGLEDPDVLIDDLREGFQRLRAA